MENYGVNDLCECGWTGFEHMAAYRHTEHGKLACAEFRLKTTWAQRQARDELRQRRRAIQCTVIPLAMLTWLPLKMLEAGMIPRSNLAFGIIVIPLAIAVAQMIRAAAIRTLT